MSRRVVALCLFAASGACGLVYQVAWTRRLTLVFGGTLPAAATVLAAFMAGLALGAHLASRTGDRARNPLRAYALLEAGIAGLAIAFPFLIGVVDSLHVAAYRASGGAALPVGLVRVGLSFVLVALPTTLMGATLPVLMRFFAADPAARVGREAGLLYGINTLGAVAGTLAAAFVLLPALGLRSTEWVAIAANLAAAAVALALARGAAIAPPLAAPAAPSPEASPENKKAKKPPPEAAAFPAVSVRAATIAFAVSGFLALGYEVVWTRLLVFEVGNTIFSFSLMLASFLLGIALGSLGASRLAPRLKDPLAALAVCEIAIGLSATLAIPLFTSGAGERVRQALAGEGTIVHPAAVTALRAAYALLVAIVPTYAMGAAFPFAARVVAQDPSRAASGVGRLYVLNTVGAILGSLVAGFVLVPLVGFRPALLSLSAANVLLGIFVLASRPGKRFFVAGLLSASAWVALLLAAGKPIDVGRVFSRPFVGAGVAPGEEVEHVLRYYSEGAGATVSVFEVPGSDKKVLSINGVEEVPTDYYSMQCFRLLGHLAMLLHENPREVATIAFGGGITLGSASLHGVSITCAEICGDVLGAAPIFAEENHHVLDNPKVTILVQDGRNFLHTAPNDFDVLIADATHPQTSDSWVLYTREFYSTARDRLAAGGLLCQWLPIHRLSEIDLKSILATFAGVFEHGTLWQIGGYCILLGPKVPLRIDWRRLEKRMAENAAVREDLDRVSLGDPALIVSCFLLGPDGLRAFSAGAPVNTDDLPHVGFGEMRSFSHDLTLLNFKALTARKEPVAPYVDFGPVEPGAGPTALAARLAVAERERKAIVSAQIALFEGRRDDAVDRFLDARAIHPGSKEVDFHLERFAAEELAVAYAAYRSGQFGFAESSAQEAARLDPTLADAWQVLGLVAVEDRRLAVAEERFQRAIEADPRSGTAHGNLGYVLMLRGDFPGARRELTKGLELEPMNDAIREHLRELETLEDRQ